MKDLLSWTLPLFLVDQLTKALVVVRFPFPGKSDFISIIPGFFQIDRVHNAGMKWGLGGGWIHANTLFLAISVTAAAFLLAVYFRGDQGNRAAVAVMIAGIFGNATDRFFRGYVIDFLTLDFGRLGVTSFNVADCCLTVAAVVLVVGSRWSVQERENRL